MAHSHRLKILAAGDFHADRRLAERLANQAEQEQVDLVILNGDIVEEDRIEGIIGPFVKKNKRVLFVHGNHESLATATFLTEQYGITHLHGIGVNYKEVGIFGCGGAQIGLSQLSEEEIFTMLQKGFKMVNKTQKKIMVTHVHPADSQMEKFSVYVSGSEGVRKAIDKLKPDIVICGHVHEAEGIEEKIGNTSVFNVGKKGRIIEI